MTEQAPVEATTEVALQPESSTPVVPETRSIKVDGEMVDVPIADLEKAYGYEVASQNRFREAAELRKEVDNFIDTLKGGDLQVLSELIPEDQLYDYAESLLRKKVEWEEQPEDVRARKMAEHERDMYKSELEEYSKKEQEQILADVNYAVSHEIDQEISTVIDEMSKEHGNIVHTPEFIQDVARIMLAQLDTGAPNVDSRAAATKALRSWHNRIGEYVKHISHDDLTSYLSKDQIKALRKAELDTAMAQFPEYQRVAAEAPKKRKKDGINVGDFFSHLDAKFA